ncbi:hypothetical protein A176_004657 [Myxococcus hansupus]|uniref:Uncharacterized protein n=1 Tax=Pseudomyxococcus hansupus TaxID=1297742 RepID=A0A0H4X271_9BACT|nr:hypothetical protein A176_004657 [Myxococcus hansupus]
MPPSKWVRRPDRTLRVVSRCGASVLQQPAYQRGQLESANVKTL